MYTLASGATAATASLRVAGGKHHVPDVLVGAALGAGIGIAVPLITLTSADEIDRDAGDHDGTLPAKVAVGFHDGQGTISGTWGGLPTRPTRRRPPRSLSPP